MITRREMLARAGAGFGALGLNALTAAPARNEGGVMAPRAPHFPARAKHVIYLFLNGGPSHVDTFDPKPMLTKYHGTPAPGQGISRLNG